MVEQFAVRHLAPEHAHCMQRYSAQQQQCLLQGITTKITMEHNVITHPGGEEFERVCRGVSRIDSACLFSPLLSCCCLFPFVLVVVIVIF